MQRRTQRQEARRLGEKTYFTGHSCHRGHIAARYTASAACVECATEQVIVIEERPEAQIREDLAQQLEDMWRRQMRRWSPE